MDLVNRVLSNISNAKISYKEKLSLIGFPSRKSGSWKYSNFLPMLSSLSEFTEGSISSSINIEDYKAELNTSDSFALLSLASSPIKLIKIEKSCDIKIDRSFNGTSSSNLVLEIAPNIEVNIEELYSSSNGNVFSYTLIKVGEHSTVNYKKIDSFNKEVKSINTLEVDLKEGSHLNALNLSNGAALLRNTLHIRHYKNATSNIDGAFILKSEHLDNFVRIEHLDSSRSKQLYKGVVYDGSSAFTGSIYIDNKAPNSSSKQLSKVILLGDGSSNSKPELEIENDQVECSHGATIGGIEEEKLFYLQSRGLTREAALSLLLDSFLLDVINREDLDKIL